MVRAVGVARAVGLARVRAVRVRVVVSVVATAVSVVATEAAAGAMVPDGVAGAIARKAPSVRASASSLI
ncbi:hypothetical protein ATI61_108204 [Archangium gephyra]|uniref:Uncharacterized protein n=1 Tax=Archangium gephyra TaxID=48 RepID=A0ABX9JWT0_9BACT|nr:hypothetical protein ATI61_108204 [Archangium gephyra]